MLQEPIYPAVLRTDLARPLVAAAQAVAQIAPWEFMADSELIGVRDERNGELRVGSILGSLVRFGHDFEAVGLVGTRGLSRRLRPCN
jgi:hypothetical protein